MGLSKQAHDTYTNSEQHRPKGLWEKNGHQLKEEVTIGYNRGSLETEAPGQGRSFRSLGMETTRKGVEGAALLVRGLVLGTIASVVPDHHT